MTKIEVSEWIYLSKGEKLPYTTLKEEVTIPFKRSYLWLLVIVRWDLLYC